MHEEDAKRLSLELMSIAEAAYLTTVDRQGFPHTRALFNLRNREQFPGLQRLFREDLDDFAIYFTTNTSSQKVEHINRSRKVSVYYCLPGEFRGLMLGGEIEIVTERCAKEAVWNSGWEKYYPTGVHDPDHTVLCLRPTFAEYYHRLDRTCFALGEQR